MKDVKNALKDIGRNGASAGPKNKEGRYGILGLLDIIRKTDKNMNLLALGQDLTAMGLNMNSSEDLYSQFSSPWSDEPPSKTPPHVTPSCYMIPPPALKAGHLKKFDIQSLFYVFYAMPRDILSMYVTKELYRRNWSYHKKTKLWFTTEGPQGPQDPTSSLQGAQEGILQFFDPSKWVLAPYTGVASDLTADFMSVAEVNMDQQQQHPNGQGGGKGAQSGGANSSS
jgi:CCR4-NOT transcription complex subunit 2